MNRLPRSDFYAAHAEYSDRFLVPRRGGVSGGTAASELELQ
jgi:hypothetical protein